MAFLEKKHQFLATAFFGKFSEFYKIIIFTNYIMKQDYIPHQIHLSATQIKKLGSGLATNLKHSQMGADKGDIVVMLRPQNARKMLSAYKKDRGIRLSLSPDELDETLKEGGGFFQTLGKYTGIKKSDVLEGAKQMGRKAIERGIPVIAEALGSAMGDHARGERIARTLGRASEAMLDNVESTKGGFKLSSSQRARDIIAEDAKDLAKEVINEKLSGMGLYGGRLRKGSEEAKEHMARIRAMKSGGKLNIGRAFKNFGRQVKSVGREIISNPIVKSIAKEVVSKALPALGEAGAMFLGDETGMSGKMAGDKVASLINQKIGSGRPRGRPRKSGGAIASNSKAYKQAMLLNKATYGVDVSSVGGDNKPLSGFYIDEKIKPSSSEMTLSPYQNITSPAMNPFKPTYYKQEGGTSCGYGGRGLY